MMGVPSEEVTHDELKNDDEKENFWRQLVDSDRKNYTMMSASRGQGE